MTAVGQKDALRNNAQQIECAPKVALKRLAPAVEEAVERAEALDAHPARDSDIDAEIRQQHTDADQDRIVKRKDKLETDAYEGRSNRHQPKARNARAAAWDCADLSV